jgi:hypothetical protein
MDLMGGTVNTGAGRVILRSDASSRTIDLGSTTDAATALELSDAELDTVTTTGVLQIGESTAGAISITSAINAANVSTITLITAGAITQTASFTETNLRTESVGAVTLTNASNDVGTLAANVSGAGNAFSYTDSNALIIGTVDTVAGVTTNGGVITVSTVAGNLTVNNAVAAGAAAVNLTAGGTSNTLDNNTAVTGNAATLRGDRIDLIGGTVNTGTGRVILRSDASSRAIDLGSTTDTAAALELSDAELDTITTTGVLQIGESTAGAISITAAINALNVSTISLITGGAITQAVVGTITETSLGLQAGGAITLNSANDVGTLAGNSTGGTIQYTDANALIINVVDGVTGVTTTGGNGNISIDVDTGVLTINAVVTANGDGNITLNADLGAITQGAVVSSTSGDLLIMGDSLAQNANITTGDVGANIGTVTLTADAGGITMADLTTTAAGTGQIVYTATGSVALSLLNTAGSVTVTAGSGSSVIGAITDNTALETANIVAGTVTLNAETGIGATGVGDIETTITTLTATNATAGDINLTETDSITLNSVVASAGNVVVTSGAAMVVTSVTAGGAGNDVTLTASTGNMTLGTLTAADTLTLTATLGAILDGNGTTNNITGVSLGLISANGIGTITDFVTATGDPIEITVNTLQTASTSTTGSVIHLSQTGNLTINTGAIVIAGTNQGSAIIQATGNIDAGAVNSISLLGNDSLGLISGGIITIPDAGFTTGGNLRLTGTSDILDSGATPRSLVLGATDLFFRSGDAGVDTTLQTTVATLDAVLTGIGNLTITETNDLTLTNISTLNGAITINVAGTVTVTQVLSSTDSDANDISITTSLGNVIIVTLNAGGAQGDVTVQATTGSIFDDGNSTTLIKGDVLTLVAAIGVGALGGGSMNTIFNAIGVTNSTSGDILISNVDGGTGTTTINGFLNQDSNGNDAGGDIVFANSGGILTIAGAITNADSGPITITNVGGAINVNMPVTVTTTAAPSGDETILIQASSPLTINAAVGTPGNITLTALGSSSTADHLTLNGNVTSSGSGSTIILNAGDDIIQSSGTITTNGGVIQVTADTEGNSSGAFTQAIGTALISNGGAINVSAFGNVSLALLNATFPLGGNVTVISTGGNIIDSDLGTFSSLDLDIDGNNITITAFGTIGDLTPNEIDLRIGGVLMLTGGASANIGVSGNVIVGSLITTGILNLAASGSILDDGNNSTTISTGTLTLTAASGIGALGNEIDIAVIILNASTTGNIVITDVAGGLQVGLVSAGSGNVTLNAIGGAITSLSNNGVADIVGNIVTLIAGADIGVSATNLLEINATIINASALGRNIFLMDTAGGLEIGLVDAGIGNVVIRVINGSIFSGPDDKLPEIIGEIVTLAVTGSGSDIGESLTDMLELSALTLILSNGGGPGANVFILNTRTGETFDGIEGSSALKLQKLTVIVLEGIKGQIQGILDSFFSASNGFDTGLNSLLLSQESAGDGSNIDDLFSFSSFDIYESTDANKSPQRKKRRATWSFIPSHRWVAVIS